MIRPLVIATVAVLLTATSYAHAPIDVIQQGSVSLSQTLAGHAIVGDDKSPISDVTVELCSPEWKTVLASTKTDENGHFSFEKPKSGDLFYLRLSAPGMDPYQLRVRIKNHAPKELTIHMVVAT